MRSLIILALGLALATANRIIGGSPTTIGQYPFAAALIASPTGTGSFFQACGASVITNTSILTAAHCLDELSSTLQLRVRVGSTNANSGGFVFTTNRIINHPSYVRGRLDNDIAIIRINGRFGFNNNDMGRIAGTNYNVADNQEVWAIGWGLTSVGGLPSEQLRHVQVWTINQNTCRNRYAEIGRTVTANMLCSGRLDVGGRDQCHGDSGGPLLHNRVIVGVCSWGEQCALARYPGVNTRVNRYTAWIQNNA